MRALLVAAAPVAGSTQLVARLAADSDLVIAVDGGGAVCLDARVTADVVLGDFDSLRAEQLDALKLLGSRVVQFSANKDETDLELAVAEARQAGVTELVVTCATSGRLDHTLAVLGALSRATDLRPEVIEPDLEVWVLDGDARDVLHLDGAGRTISLIAPIGSAIVSVEGVRWPLERATLPPASGLGVSNAISSADGCTITAHGGVLLVLAPHVDGAQRLGAL